MFALIQNNNIQVGPRQWLYSEFNEYLEDNNLDTTLISRVVPISIISNKDFKILPVIEAPLLSYDTIYEQLAGPIYTINKLNVTGTYSISPVSIDSIKNILKAKVSENRYKFEVSGISVDLGNSKIVKVYTDRENRNIYLNAMQLLPIDASVAFKFSDSNFEVVTKPDLELIVSKIVSHVQDAFNLEHMLHIHIDSALTTDELKLIKLEFGVI